MFVNLIWLIAFLVITGLGVLFLIKLFRPFGGVKRIFGGVLLGFVTLIVGLFTVLALLGMIEVYAPRGNSVAEASVAGTDVQISRGRTIADWSCASCHSLNKELPLSGGSDIFVDVPMPIGKATPPNLTSASRIADWSDGEIQRAIREGTSADGHLMAMMSINNFRYFSQPDLDALVAYLRSMPAVESEVKGESHLSFLAMGMVTLGLLPVKDPPDFEPPAHIDPGATAEYGEYMVRV